MDPHVHPMWCPVETPVKVRPPRGSVVGKTHPGAAFQVTKNKSQQSHVKSVIF